MLGGSGAAVGCWDRDGGSGSSSQSKGSSMSRAPLRAGVGQSAVRGSAVVTLNPAMNSGMAR